MKQGKAVRDFLHRLPFIMWDGFLNSYPIGESNILGNAKSDHADYDKRQVTLLCLDGKPTGKENVVGMLDVALANGMPAEEKSGSSKPNMTSN